jgi:hypothetical protein
VDQDSGSRDLNAVPPLLTTQPGIHPQPGMALSQLTLGTDSSGTPNCLFMLLHSLGASSRPSKRALVALYVTWSVCLKPAQPWLPGAPGPCSPPPDASSDRFKGLQKSESPSCCQGKDHRMALRYEALTYSVRGRCTEEAACRSIMATRIRRVWHGICICHTGCRQTRGTDQPGDLWCWSRVKPT